MFDRVCQQIKFLHFSEEHSFCLMFLRVVVDFVLTVTPDIEGYLSKVLYLIKEIPIVYLKMLLFVNG